MSIQKNENPLLHFKVEIIAQPMTTAEGTTFEKTVLVNLFNDSGKKIEVLEYAWMDKNEIFRLIENEQDINLNNCYVKDFSLSEYRNSKGLSERSVIKLQSFSARRTFFDCDTEIDFSYSEFDGNKTSFESSIFGNGLVNFTGANFGHGDVNFKKTKFGDGKIDFQYVQFGTGNISFQFSNFGNGDKSFVNADFSDGNVDFKTVTFGDGNVDFKFAKFGNGDISFEKASFGDGKKDFKTVEFGGGKVDFRRVSFGSGDVTFEETEFGNGKVSFKSAVFENGDISFYMADFGEGEASFEQVEFGTGKVSFNNAKTTEISFKSCQFNNYLDLRFTKCNSIDLSDTIVRDIIDLRPQDFPVDIKEMNMTGMKNLGRIYIEWKANNVHDLIYNQKTSSLSEKADQFRILKQGFNTTGQYNDEDKAYIEFKRCEQKAEIEDALKENKSNAVWAYPAYFFKYLVFDKMGLYATEPTRVLASMLVVYLIFSLSFFGIIMTGLGDIHTGVPNPEPMTKFTTSMYLSAVTFFTIGYGDYFPYGLLRWCACTEGFCGVFMMSYFTVAFVRKILR